MLQYREHRFSDLDAKASHSEAGVFSRITIPDCQAAGCNDRCPATLSPSAAAGLAWLTGSKDCYPVVAGLTTIVQAHLGVNSGTPRPADGRTVLEEPGIYELGACPRSAAADVAFASYATGSSHLAPVADRPSNHTESVPANSGRIPSL
jgi:hypothetical protein